jgi:hypothetical protein
MHVGTKARRRRHRITEVNFKRHGEFEKPGKSQVEYDCCDHGNGPVIVVTKTSSVILFRLLISFTDNKLRPAIFTKRRVFKI